MVALASAFVRIRPQVDKTEFKKAGEQAGADAGAAAGKTYGEGFKRGSDGKLRDARGKFVTDSDAAGGKAGSKAGDSFSSGFGKGSKKLAGAIKSNLGLAVGVFVPLGLAAAIGEIGKIGIAYQDNLNIFQTVTGATGKQMDAVAAKARTLGADVKLPGVSAAGAAAAMTELGKAGFTVQQSMDAARSTLLLARVASIDEAQAAEIASNAVNAFGISAKDTTFVVDELAAAANSSSIDVTEASDAFKQAASVFSGIQGPAVGSKEAITELNTAIAILGNNGIKGQDAGTSLKQALLQLTGPSGAAKDAMKLLALQAGNLNIPLKQQSAILSGSTKVRRLALKAILDANPGMKKQGDIAYDSTGKMRSLRDIIGLLAAGTHGMTQEQKNLAITTIFGADASRTILALLRGAVPVYDAQRRAVLQSGAAAKFAAAKNAGLGGAIDNVKSQFENAAITIYNLAKGPLTTGLNAVANALPGIFADIGKFTSFVVANIGVIRDWAGAIAAVSIALKINSTMLAVNAAGGVLAYLRTINLVVFATKVWTAIQAALDVALNANPIGAIIVLVTAFVAGIVLLYRHNAAFRKLVQAVWSAIKTAVGATISWITGVAWPALKAAWNAIAAAALWLWRSVFVPTWHGIMAVVGVVVAAVKVYIRILVAEFHAVSAVVMWLWHNVFGPVFAVLRKIVEVWWLAVQVVFKGLYNIITFVVTSAVNRLKAVFSAVFNFIVNAIIRPWWGVIQAIFRSFRTYILGPVASALSATRNFFSVVFSAIAGYIRSWWTAHVKPVIDAVRGAWTALAGSFSAIYNSKIRPLFAAFVGFIQKTVVGGFKSGVDAITAAWHKVQDAARVPVAFVVNHVINPFINGLNRAAAIVGVKDRVSPITGFRAGGKISGAGGITDNRQAVIPGVGAVQLQGGEFIVNRQDTARAYPVLKWINSGMKGGAKSVARYIGRPLADMPGDGSEGWAFKDGGLIGFVKDVWGAISHPLDTIKRPFEAALGAIPGGGLIRDFIIGGARKLAGGAISWLTKFAGGSGKVGDAIKFLHAQDGKPYVWASAGPGGYDCSGIVSAVYNLLHGKSPYSHTFSTDSASSFFPKDGMGGPMQAAWSHPGEAPAGSSVGHMMGKVGPLTFESSGSRGVHLGSTTRSLSDFARIGHYRDGGLFGAPVKLFDGGGYWPTGTLGVNLSGRTEYVDPNRNGDAGGITINFNEGAFSGAIVANSKQAEDMVVTAIRSAKHKRRLT
jgi:TP901 family phage tail tape measure protein